MEKKAGRQKKAGRRKWSGAVTKHSNALDLEKESSQIMTLKKLPDH